LPLLHAMEGEGRGEEARLLEVPLSLTLPMNPWEHRTSNIQHPTANQWPNWKPLVVRFWMLVLDVFLRFMGSMREIFRGNLSPFEAKRVNHSCEFVSIRG